ncbi:MAG: serine hydrolase domain-containing protein, partial [Gammaproteobacteria bacterium]
MKRRDVLGMGLGLGVAAASWSGEATANAGPPPGPGASRYAAAFERLDRYVAQFMAEMNAPGMTLVLADESGVQRVMDYGFEDLERRVALRSGRLFHIGSITKSFLGLCLVQLAEEGKLDLHRPIRDYL